MLPTGPKKGNKAAPSRAGASVLADQLLSVTTDLLISELKNAISPPSTVASGSVWDSIAMLSSSDTSDTPSSSVVGLGARVGFNSSSYEFALSDPAVDVLTWAPPCPLVPSCLTWAPPCPFMTSCSTSAPTDRLSEPATSGRAGGTWAGGGSG